MNMNVNIAGVEWKNPVTVASGTFGSGEEFSEFVDLNKLGAITTKGVADVPWAGNPTPRVAEVYGGMMNAIGLQNPGIDLFCERDIPYLQKYDTKIIVNVRTCFHNIDDDICQTDDRCQFNRTVQLDDFHGLMLFVIKIILGNLRILGSHTDLLMMLQQISGRFRTADTHPAFSKSKI